MNKIEHNSENYTWKKLEWDTCYFGVGAAKITLNGIISDFNQEIILKKLNNFDFTTIVNVNNQNDNNIWLGKIESLFLSDINIQFEKNIIQKPREVDHNSKIYNSYPKNLKVQDIAKNSFGYSRFTNDPYLAQEKTKNIYLQWTISAFGKEKKYFIITKRENEIAGYILFSIVEDFKTAVIELIAVDEKFRGTQVGKSLMHKLEEYAFINEIVKIRVGTQLNNINAVNFYSKLAYKYKSCSSVYHMWNNEKHLRG